jgi:hypothetical protein
MPSHATIGKAECQGCCVDDGRAGLDKARFTIILITRMHGRPDLPRPVRPIRGRRDLTRPAPCRPGMTAGAWRVAAWRMGKGMTVGMGMAPGRAGTPGPGCPAPGDQHGTMHGMQMRYF